MDAWRHTLEAILDAPGVVVMLGPVDVGKTTRATAIVNAALRARHRTAVVDADTGQSDIGPPTTVGLAMPRRPASRMDRWAAAAAFFAGDTSAQQVHPYLIEGTARSVERACARGAEVIVVDTTGWVQGAAAVAAKVRKLRRIDPRHVVALQRCDEVEPILDHLPSGVAVHRLRPSPRVRHRSFDIRRTARLRRFHEYFMHARRHTLTLTALPATRLPIHHGREVPRHRMLADIPCPELRHLLVGLADQDGWLKAIGSVVDVARQSQSVTVVAPIASLAGVASLQWGVLRVGPSGLEEGRLV